MNGKLVAGIIIILLAASAAAYYFGGKYSVSVSPRPLQDIVPVTTEGTTPTQTVLTTVTPSLDAQKALITDVLDGLVAKHGPDARNMTITVTLIDGDYAKGTANATGGGGIWFAKKTGNAWSLVWDGNGIITCDAIPKDFPNTIITQCFDGTNLVTR